jgi:hypothetical protein
MARKNPKLEARNPKQTTKFKETILKTARSMAWRERFEHLNFSFGCLFRISCFELRVLLAGAASILQEPVRGEIHKNQ